jgi:hypothetical protein
MVFHHIWTNSAILSYIWPAAGAEFPEQLPAVFCPRVFGIQSVGLSPSPHMHKGYTGFRKTHHGSPLMVKLGYLTIPKDGGVPASLPLCFPS